MKIHRLLKGFLSQATAYINQINFMEILYDYLFYAT